MEIFWERPGQGGQSEPIARFLEEQGLRPDHAGEDPQVGLFPEMGEPA